MEHQPGVFSTMRPMPRRAGLLVVAWLAVVLASASPRNTGDASEYLGMAMNLARLAPPALSEADIEAFNARLAASPERFELTTRRLPELRGSDGRYDMPHMWVYALLAVPGVWATWPLDIPPAWAFVALNTALFGGLLALAVWRGAGPWTLLLAASPLVWWLDKPLADLFIAAMLGTAVLCWPRHGPLGLVALGLAAAQNPALAVPCIVFAIAAVAGDRTRLRDRRWWFGAIAGAAVAAVGPAYALWRLGRVSPLTSYTTASWPSMASLLFPLADINMGAVVGFPPGAIAVGLVLLRAGGWRSPAALPAALSAAALLAIVSQQPNMNQGGNPDFSRYAVWLAPLALPWLLAADRSPRRLTRYAGVALLVAGAGWTLVAFRPSRPESYRYPTALASWVWSAHPSWTQPRPEAFAERTSHREPALVPTATPGCEKVLLYEGLWPASCPPSYAETPTTCGHAGVFCYADLAGPGWHQVRVAGTLAGYHPERHDRTWHTADPVAQWLHERVRQHAIGESDDAPAFVRGSWQVGWTQAWSSPSALVVYVRDAGRQARLAVRTRRAVEAIVETPDGSVARRFSIEATRDEPALIELPAAPHVVVSIGPTSMPSSRPRP